jgi:hypothetical protein
MKSLETFVFSRAESQIHFVPVVLLAVLSRNSKAQQIPGQSKWSVIDENRHTRLR